MYNKVEGLGPREFLALLKERDDAIRLELASERSAHTERRVVMEAELLSLRMQYADLGSSLLAYKERLADTASKLEELRMQVPEADLEAALNALRQGRQELADALLAQAEEKASSQLKRMSRQAARAAFQRGVIAETSVKYLEALEHYGRAVSHDPSQSSYANAAGFIAARLGKFTEAGQHFEAALALVPDQAAASSALIDILSNLAGVHLTQGKAATAISILNRVKRIEEDTDAPPVNRAKTLNSLGGAYQAAGFYDFTRDCYEQSLAIREAEKGHESLDVAATLNNLGDLFFETRALARSRECHEEALRLRRKLLPPLHPDLFLSLNNVASVYLATGSTKGVKALLMQALDIQKSVYGPVHHTIARTLNNVGQVEGRQGDAAAAVARFREALEMSRATLGDDHSQSKLIEKNLRDFDQPSARKTPSLFRRFWH